MSFITTFTGKHFDPVNPDPEQIDIRDIAHSLSFTCRGNGHVNSFFSVAQHCIYCALESEARGNDDVISLACLLHDASESYMSDVPRPIKNQMVQYIETENNLIAMIYQKYIGRSLNEHELKEVKSIDDDLLLYDLRYLLKEDQITLPNIHININYDFVPFSDAENLYIKLFNTYFHKSR